MKKYASILDYSYPGISPDIWLSDGTLNLVHKDFVLKLLNSFYNSYELKSPEQWVIDVTVIGSLTTNRYIRSSDFDCHVIIDIDKFITTNMPNASKEKAITYLDNARKTWDRAKILMPFGEHVLELYIEDPNLNPSNTEYVGRYSMFQNRWLKDPIYFAQDLDFEISRKEAIEGAKVLANELDDSFGEIGRQIQRIDELKEVLQAWPEDKRQLYYTKVQNKLDIIEEQLEKSIQIKQDLVDQRHLKQDAFSENEIQFKFLARFHYFSILQNLKTLLEQTGGKVTTQELPLIDKIISQGTIKEADKLPNLTQFILNDKEINQHFKNRGISVKDIISNPSPKLRIKYISKGDPDFHNRGFYDEANGELQINPNLTEDERRSTIIHELEHVLQNEGKLLSPQYKVKKIPYLERTEEYAARLQEFNAMKAKGMSLDQIGEFFSAHFPNRSVEEIDNEVMQMDQISKEMMPGSVTGTIKEAFLKEAFEEEPKETDTDICVDFDRTIAKAAKHPDIGEPIDGAKESLAKLKELGYNVIIYSCRGDTEEGLKAVEDWMDAYDMPYDSIFSGEKPFYKYLIDDRAIHFDNNWDEIVDQIEKSEKKASLVIVAAHINLPVIDPKTLGRKEPYALFIGTGDYGSAGKIDMFNVYGEHPMITKSNVLPTVTLDTLIQNNIPVIGKEPRAGEKQPFQDISGIVKTAIGSPSAWLMDPNGKLYPAINNDHQETIDALAKKGVKFSFSNGWSTVRVIGNNVAFAVGKLNSIPNAVQNYLDEHNFNNVEIIPEDANLEGLSQPPTVKHKDITFGRLQKEVNRNIMMQRRMKDNTASNRHISFSKRDLVAKTKKVKQGNYGAIMALVPHDIAQEIVEFGVRNIKDSDVFSDEDNPRLGRELEPHVTVKYGLLEDNPKTVRRFFNDSKPFKAKLGKVRHFEPPEMEFDVVTVEVISEDLEEMNKKVTDHFKCAHGLVSDEYHPHITICYVEKGSSEKYIGSTEFEGKEIILDTLIISPRKGNRTYFSLNVDKDSQFVLEKIEKIGYNYKIGDKVRDRSNGKVGIIKQINGKEVVLEEV